MKQFAKDLLTKKYAYLILLTSLFFLFFCMTVPSGCLFGSEGDWFSQHTALAEQFRQIFYETGRIFPDYTLLGGGSSLYDISYYGFLRPDVLISFVLPSVPMAYIISAYAALAMLAAVLLCFLWLSRQVSHPFFAFLGAFFCGCAACFFHAHHQIMFVNYLPFLFLALMGLDRFLKKRRADLFILSLFLVYLHSFYFSVAVLFVCFVYFLHQSGLSGIPLKSPEFFRLFRGFACSVLLSIGLAGILLVPTGIDLLSNRKDAGIPTALSEILSGTLSMESLLYSRYSCGLTLFCLYAVFTGIRRRSTRWLSILLLSCLTLNVVPYLLSGLLYVRYKVLIPLIPLLLLLCVQTLEELHQKKIRYSIPILTCCLIPLCSSEVPQLILADFGLILLTLVLCRFWKGRMPAVFFLILCMVPASAAIDSNRNETWISASDNRQNIFSLKELAGLSLDQNYRFACLTEPFANANTTLLPGMGTANLYSSITNTGYADYFYDTAKNPIRIRNRVALLTDANPVFSYLMGIRYIQAPAGQLPAGYQVIAEKNGIVLAENKDVLPTAYTSTSLMPEQEYQQLAFPESLAALARYTVVPGSDGKTGSDHGASSDTGPDIDTNDGTGSAHRFSANTISGNISGISSSKENQQIIKDFFQSLADQNEHTSREDSAESPESISFSLKKETSLTLPLSLPKNKMLILSFSITAPDGDELTITINGTRNKRSGKKAPYPNRNDTFTYQLSFADSPDEVFCILSAGDYKISDIQAFTADLSLLKNNGVTPFSYEKEKGSAILKGTASLEEDGYFVTSYPWRKGYNARADGASVEIQKVGQGFVGFPLAKGSHKITLFYAPPGKNAGAFLSLASFIIYFILLKKRKCIL